MNRWQRHSEITTATAIGNGLLRWLTGAEPEPSGTRYQDAYVNDNRREIWGTDAIRAFMAKEFVGNHVTMDVREVIDHYGDIIVRAKYDGTYDKTDLPDELIMTSYFGIREGKIISLAVIFNQPSPTELGRDRRGPSTVTGTPWGSGMQDLVDGCDDDPGRPVDCLGDGTRRVPELTGDLSSG
jgi:hypothetical protein